MSKEQYDYLLKIIVVGDAAVGKTALTVRFAEDKFRDDYKVTIGVDFCTKTIKVSGQRVKVQVWDTGGQEQFSYIRPLYYAGSLGGLVVFDKTNRRSFNNIDKWFREVIDNRGLIPLLLIGNKVDLPNNEVTTEEATELAKKHNTLYFDASAKSGKSVELIFITLIQLILEPKYVDRLKAEQGMLEKPQMIYDGSYEKYNTLSNQAVAYFQAGNRLEALFSLEKALHWAEVSGFDEGVRWCKDQIDYITQLVNEDTLPEIKNIVLFCENCSIYFQVNKEGTYSCPKCYKILKKI